MTRGRAKAAAALGALSVALACGAIVAVIPATIPACAVAAPGWQGPIRVAETAEHTYASTAVAMDAAGDTLVVWSQPVASYEVIEASWRPAGGAFGAPVQLSRVGDKAHDPVVAMDPRGDATVVWLSFRIGSIGLEGIVEAASRPVGGAFGTAVALSSSEESGEPVVAMDAKGDATVAWATYDLFHTIDVASRPAGGTFGPQVVLSAHNEKLGPNAYDPAIAMDPQGDTAIAWRANEIDPTGRATSSPYIQVVMRPAGGSFGPTTNLPAFIAGPPTVAIDPHGNATVAWSEYTNSNQAIVEASTYTTANGAFATPAHVHFEGLDEAQALEVAPTAKTDEAGDTLLFWYSPADGALLSAAAPAGGSFGDPAKLASPDLIRARATVAMNGRGDSVLAWPGVGETGAFPLAAMRPAGGVFGAPVFLSGTSHPLVELGLPPVSVAIDAQADAVSAWIGSEGGHDMVEVNTYLAPEPPLEPPKIPVEVKLEPAQPPPQPLPSPHPPPRPPKIPRKVLTAPLVPPFTPLFATQTSSGQGVLGLLVGIAAVRGTLSGETIVVRCIAGCRHALHLVVHVSRRHNASGNLTISPPFPLSGATRIEVVVRARGRRARFVDYRFVRTSLGVIAHVARRGCLSSSGRPRVCV
ncbi:MAG TPA: hypothetical protein VGY76_09655 [Solirubrobacteraceae bacterium]|jgi:hypothetical protein|nr:hypothetical protein [Solirubrobacteraceae bacterium]